jgi:hypothetical protein
MPHYGFNSDGGSACAILYFGTAPGPARSAKAGVIGFAKSLAYEVARDGITVNAALFPRKEAPCEKGSPQDRAG